MSERQLPQPRIRLAQGIEWRGFWLCYVMGEDKRATAKTEINPLSNYRMGIGSTPTSAYFDWLMRREKRGR